MRTQRVTVKDIDAGQIRVPIDTKALFPRDRSAVTVSIRGTRMTAKWDPRNGPDRARSGVVRLGRGKLDRLLRDNEILDVTRSPAGVLEFG